MSCPFMVDFALFLRYNICKTISFPSSICLLNEKQRNLLFCYTMKPTKHLKTCLAYIIFENEANLSKLKKNNRLAIV